MSARFLLNPAHGVGHIPLTSNTSNSSGVHRLAERLRRKQYYFAPEVLYMMPNCPQNLTNPMCFFLFPSHSFYFFTDVFRVL